MRLFKALLRDTLYLGASYYNRIVLLNIIEDFECLLHSDGRMIFYNSEFIVDVFNNFPNIFTQVEAVSHDMYGKVLVAHVDEHQLYVTATVIDYADMRGQLINAN